MSYDNTKAGGESHEDESTIRPEDFEDSQDATENTESVSDDEQEFDTSLLDETDTQQREQKESKDDIRKKNEDTQLRVWKKRINDDPNQADNAPNWVLNKLFPAEEKAENTKQRAHNESDEDKYEYFSLRKSLEGTKIAKGTYDGLITEYRDQISDGVPRLKALRRVVKMFNIFKEAEDVARNRANSSMLPSGRGERVRGDESPESRRAKKLLGITPEMEKRFKEFTKNNS